MSSGIVIQPIQTVGLYTTPATRRAAGVSRFSTNTPRTDMESPNDMEPLPVPTMEPPRPIVASTAQWILAGLIMVFLSPVCFAGYLAATMKIATWYYKSTLVSDFSATLSFHDRVYLSLFFFVLNFVAYQFTGFLLRRIEQYATHVVSSWDGFQPIDYASVKLSSQEALNFDLYSLVSAVWHWFAGNIRPVKLLSTMSWSVLAACNRFHTILYWMASISFVILLCRSVYDIPYHLLPDANSQVLGPIVTLMSTTFAPAGQIYNMFIGGHGVAL